jgi:hypothetical protein
MSRDGRGKTPSEAFMSACFRRPAWLVASLLPAALALPLVQTARADSCSGHELLSAPRAETSCQTVKPQIFVAPDKKTHAVVLPTEVSLDATPDMESRVVIRSAAGDTLNSQDYSSPRGSNGYYVVTAQWSPDSQFFVFSLSSSGGHSPWSFPMKVYGLQKNQFADFSDMINGNPTVSGDFKFSGPHTVTASTWKQPGDTDNKVPVTVDLDAAFAKLKPPAN